MTLLPRHAQASRGEVLGDIAEESSSLTRRVPRKNERRSLSNGLKKVSC